MTRHVTLGELDQRSEPINLTSEVATALADTELVDVRPQGNGRWLLVPRGRVGAVRINDLQVQVIPKEKVGLTRLLFLLGYASDPGFLATTAYDVEAVEQPDLWPALAEALTRLTERALLHGVLQGYRTVDEATRTVRGRIRISDQITRRPGILIPLEVSYDDYTVDTAENRILRAALRRMMSVPGISEKIQVRLAHLDRKLDGVTLIDRGTALPHWQPSRLNFRYQPALRLAEIVLRNASAEAAPGGLHVAAFVVEMWRVFEDFVTTALTDSLSRRYRGNSVTQYPSFLDEPTSGAKTGRVKLLIDLVHLVDGIPRIIFDAKYKVASPGGKYPNADHYQMLAYCTALKLPTAWLVYAAGRDHVAEHRVVNTDVTVMVYPLDLSAAPYALLEQIDRLVDRAASYPISQDPARSQAVSSQIAVSRA